VTPHCFIVFTSKNDVGGIDDAKSNVKNDDETNGFKHNDVSVGLGSFSSLNADNEVVDSDDTEKGDDVRDSSVELEDYSRDKAQGGSEAVLGYDF
jgi:hypothetical protein